MLLCSLQTFRSYASSSIFIGPDICRQPWQDLFTLQSAIFLLLLHLDQSHNRNQLMQLNRTHATHRETHSTTQSIKHDSCNSVACIVTHTQQHISLFFICRSALRSQDVPQSSYSGMWWMLSKQQLLCSLSTPPPSKSPQPQYGAPMMPLAPLLATNYFFQQVFYYNCSTFPFFVPCIHNMFKLN